jgi:4-hydroxy-2-oxoheptanedioate aldolase
MPANPFSAGATSGVWCMIDSPLVISAVASAGFDWISLDIQHGGFDRASVIRTLQLLAGTTETPVFVRTSRNDSGQIGWALDAGAIGVIVPMIETADDARAAVASTFYQPLGRRSWGPLTDFWATPSPSAADANASVICGVMIETPEALANVDEIAAIEGIGLLFVGPHDLSLALGTTPDALIADTSTDAPLTRIRQAARDAGIPVAVFGGVPERAARFRELGFEHVSVATDAGLIALGAAESKRIGGA